MTDTEIKEAIALLRTLEIEWLTDELRRAIANLCYPVGMGIAPHPETLRKAAERLFERYAEMIEMAARGSLPMAQ